MIFKTRTRNGFTLIELLVVMAIIGILIALLLPAVQAARTAARRTQTRNNLRQIGIALHNYHENFKTFPPGWIGVASGVPDIEGGSGFGWGAMILPFLEQDPLYDSIDFKRQIDDPANLGKYPPLAVFRSPSDIGPDRWQIEDENMPGTVLATLPTSNYVGSFGTTSLEDCHLLPAGTVCEGNGVFFHNSSVKLRDLLDGVSNTFIVGERRSDVDKGWHSTWVGAVPKGEEHLARIVGFVDHTPNHPDGHFDDYSSYDPGGAHFLFGDGHVRLINDLVDFEMFKSQATREGYEALGN